MKDRVSTKILDNGATRYGVYDETGKLLRYEYIKLEDEPTVEGDLFSKANMLPDSIPAALGLKMGNPQVKDALNVLAHVGNLHVWERAQSGVTDYLTSTDRNAYTNGTVGNTTITYLGQLGGGTRIEVVSYVGTGTYGSSNPNSLTFDFVPKVIVIQSSENSIYGSCIVLNGTKNAITYPSTNDFSKFSWNEKTVSWYNQNDVDYQLNMSGVKYTAIAIG